jgi:hypothetical protein
MIEPVKVRLRTEHAHQALYIARGTRDGGPKALLELENFLNALAQHEVISSAPGVRSQSYAIFASQPNDGTREAVHHYQPQFRGYL